MPALGGLDAHDYMLRIRGRRLRPIPNERYFRLLHTRVLVGRALGDDVAAAAAEIYAALSAGRCFLAVEAFGSAEGFRFWGEGDGRPIVLGEEGRAGAWSIHVRAPCRARLRLLRNGDEMATAEGDSLDCHAEEPRVYRAEAHLEVDGRNRTWIVSNPIYLRA